MSDKAFAAECKKPHPLKSTVRLLKYKETIMAIVIKNNIKGKECSSCKKWKSLRDFSPDSTHSATQGGRHCVCKKCQNDKARKRRSAS